MAITLCCCRSRVTSSCVTRCSASPSLLRRPVSHRPAVHDGDRRGRVHRLGLHRHVRRDPHQQGQAQVPNRRLLKAPSARFFLTSLNLWRAQEVVRSQGVGRGGVWRSSRGAVPVQRTSPGEHRGPDPHDKFSPYRHEGEARCLRWVEPGGTAFLTFPLVSGEDQHCHQRRRRRPQEPKQELAALQGGRERGRKRCERLAVYALYAFRSPSALQSQFRLCLQEECRASLYEPGKTVLRYEKRLGSAPVPPSSIIHVPYLSESSHTSEGSQETADSGHYSNEESNEEMSNPSASQRSRPQSFGPDDTGAELKRSFAVENEEIPSQPCHRPALHPEDLHPTRNAAQPAGSWRRSADPCEDTSTSDYLPRNEGKERQLLWRRTYPFASDLPQDLRVWMFHRLSSILFEKDLPVCVWHCLS